MHVLLLGATGNVGSRLLPALLAHSHTVVVLVRSESKLRSVIPSPLLTSVTILQGDASSASTIKAALVYQGCDAIVNSAGLASILPWQKPSMQHIIQAVAQGVIDASEELDWPIRAWFLGGMGVLDYPAFPGVKLSRYIPLFMEHAQTHAHLSSLPVQNIQWSMFCPSVMAPKETSIKEDIPEKGNGLKAEKDVPAGFHSWGIDWIPFIGPLVTVLGQAGKYNTSLEDCADWIAADLADGEAEFVGHRVGIIDMGKKKQ